MKANAQTTDNGTYYLVVTNNFGTVTTASATVTLTPTYFPIIDTAPVGTTLYPGGTLNLSVVAEGGGLKYQWVKASTPIAGATLATYTFPRVTTTNAGTYSVIVTNNSGAVTSAPVTVNILVPATNSYEAAIVADAPEAWYRLDDAPGSLLLHDTLGRHDGYYTNTSGSLPTLGTSGALASDTNKSVYFDGTSKAYGVVPFSPNLNTEEFAVEAWVRAFTAALERIPHGFLLPEAIFLIAGNDVSLWFAQALASEELKHHTLTEKDFAVVLLEKNALAKFVNVSSEAHLNHFSVIEAIFISHI